VLKKDDWWKAAENLEVGQRRRVGHYCGEGTPLLVSRDLDGYRAFCFRCNDAASERPPAETLGERLTRLAKQGASDSLVISSGVALPQPALYDLSKWPVAAKLWLYKAGLGAFEIEQLGAFYHEATGRVVLPVRMDGNVVFWQARSVDGRQPKYLAPHADRSKILACYGHAKSVTLCEDILSAFKVGLEAEGWSLMGTVANDYAIQRLLQRGLPVNVWMDPDKPGQTAASKIRKRLSAVGLRVRNVVSNKDPKLMTRQQIKELLT
jgi:hypothetical protein